MLPDPKASSTVGATAASAPWLQVIGSETPADKAKVWDRCILKLFGESLESCPKILVWWIFVIFASRKPFPASTLPYIYPPKKTSLKEIKISSRKIIKISSLSMRWISLGSLEAPCFGSSLSYGPRQNELMRSSRQPFGDVNGKILPVEKRDWRIVWVWSRVKTDRI